MSFSPFIASAKIGGKTITIETGFLGRQAHGAVLITCGEDKVFTTVVSMKEELERDFVPLSVEYQEKLYSAGKIPGGFFRREGRPAYEAILIARMIDRPLRPCFPEGYCYDTQISATALSYSGQSPIGVLASIGASSALHISDIPFNGPVACVQVIKIGDDFLINPVLEEVEKADLNFIVSGTRQGILMVEGEARFVSEATALSALKFAHQSMRPLLDMQDNLRKQAGNTEKRVWSGFKVKEDLEKEITAFSKDKIKENLSIVEKTPRYQAFDDLKKDTIQHVAKKEDSEKESALKERTVALVLDKLKYNLARSVLLKSKQRIDKRKYNEVRPIACHTGWLPRVHGSALFTRGETQVLGSVTLGTVDDEQKVDALAGFFKKHFLLHYNFPPYCVRETGRIGGQSRREVGHGILAEKALKAIIPEHEKFPYTIRVVSEVLESNGSSSMGTVCSGCLALMDAGVPIKEPVAGIAMGLIKEKDQVEILSDILGDEDHLGDMDFKVAGTKDGITALQMDIKTDSLSFEVMEKALAQAKEGRLHILDEMSKTLSKHREKLSPYAPIIEMITIKTEKIGEVIGSSGKNINKIIEETGVKVDIQDSGQVYISASERERIARAKRMIEDICKEVEAGAIYDGKVVKIATFGAFVEILPQTTGLLHISEIAHRRINEVSDVLSTGDRVKVKVLEVGEKGRIRLSRKALMSKDEDEAEAKKTEAKANKAKGQGGQGQSRGQG